MDFTPAVATVNTLDELMSEITFDVPTQPMFLFDIAEVPKADLFLALYNAAAVVYRAGENDLTIQDAQRIVQGYTGCGYDYPPLQNFSRAGRGGCGYGHVDEEGVFRGRKLNIDLSGDEMDTSGYDEANGEAAAFHATRTLMAAIEAGITPALGA